MGVALVGIIVVGAMAIAHWDVIRDQLDVWQFHLTRETVTPMPQFKDTPVKRGRRLDRTAVTVEGMIKRGYARG
jgi:hypothetical protein